MEENMIVIRGPRTFCFNFDSLENESLAENKIKNEIEQLLFKYKSGNNIHEHRKQQNKSAT